MRCYAQIIELFNWCSYFTYIRGISATFMHAFSLISTLTKIVFLPWHFNVSRTWYTCWNVSGIQMLLHVKCTRQNILACIKLELREILCVHKYKNCSISALIALMWLQLLQNKLMKALWLHMIQQWWVRQYL